MDREKMGQDQQGGQKQGQRDQHGQGGQKQGQQGQPGKSGQNQQAHGWNDNNKDKR